MSVRITQDGVSVPPTQVWSGLTTECQARVIQFLASRFQSRDRRVKPNPSEASR
jgi:hypothetical protein